jgi:hypothetical protein
MMLLSGEIRTGDTVAVDADRRTGDLTFGIAEHTVRDK